jgi:hypothetical protein
MTETSRKIFEFLKKHSSKEFTKHELVEEVDTTMSAVNGSVNWLLKKGYASERIEITRAKYKGQKDMEMRFVQITPAGCEYDPDEEERRKKRLQLKAAAARKEERARQKAERARLNSVL